MTSWLPPGRCTPSENLSRPPSSKSRRITLASHSKHVKYPPYIRYIGQEIEWEGKGDSEIGKEKATGKIRVKVNPKYYRPTEVEELLGDSTKARTKLGWSPKVKFDMLVKDMMDSDIELMKKNPSA